MFTVSCVVCAPLRERSKGLRGGVESLRKVAQEPGFRYVKKDASLYLRQTPSVAAQRLTFLRDFLVAYKTYGLDNFVYVDETWVLRKGTGKGKRESLV